MAPIALWTEKGFIQFRHVLQNDDQSRGQRRVHPVLSKWRLALLFALYFSNPALFFGWCGRLGLLDSKGVESVRGSLSLKHLKYGTYRKGNKKKAGQYGKTMEKDKQDGKKTRCQTTQVQIKYRSTKSKSKGNLINNGKYQEKGKRTCMKYSTQKGNQQEKRKLI